MMRAGSLPPPPLPPCPRACGHSNSDCPASPVSAPSSRLLEGVGSVPKCSFRPRVLQPKCGFIPLCGAVTHELKHRVCRYCMHQHLKVRRLGARSLGGPVTPRAAASGSKEGTLFTGLLFYESFTSTFFCLFVSN